MLSYLARPDNVEWLTARDDHGAAITEVRGDIAEIRKELADLAAQVGAGKVSATLAATAEPAILARLKDAEQREQELSTPSVLRAIMPGKDVARRWKSAPMSARREVARLLLAPGVLGELRVTRSTTPGHRCPVGERVSWRRTPPTD
jgi:site-specific DNA recombinase